MDEIPSFLSDHWPWFGVMALLWLIGHFMETSFWTKSRALEHHPVNHGRPKSAKEARAQGWKDPRSFGQKFHHWLFYWGRESMELHAPLSGALIGLMWKNPEHADPAWGTATSVGYFATAGLMSLFGWLLIVKVLGRVGIDVSNVTLPGESQPPDKPDDK